LATPELSGGSDYQSTDYGSRRLNAARHCGSLQAKLHQERGCGSERTNRRSSPPKDKVGYSFHRTNDCVAFPLPR
jgi:hypothetical protein